MAEIWRVRPGLPPVFGPLPFLLMPTMRSPLIKLDFPALGIPATSSKGPAMLNLMLTLLLIKPKNCNRQGTQK